MRFVCFESAEKKTKILWTHNCWQSLIDTAYAQWPVLKIPSKRISLMSYRNIISVTKLIGLHFACIYRNIVHWPVLWTPSKLITLIKNVISLPYYEDTFKVDSTYVCLHVIETFSADMRTPWNVTALTERLFQWPGTRTLSNGLHLYTSTCCRNISVTWYENTFKTDALYVLLPGHVMEIFFKWPVMRTISYRFHKDTSCTWLQYF